MTQGNYRTVFQIGFHSFPWPGVADPLIFIAIGLLLIWFLKNRRPYLVIGVVISSLASVFLLVSLVTYVPSFMKLRNAYVTGKSSVVGGVVQNFPPAPTIGAAKESFSVGGVLFSYNALDETPCFHNAPVHRGPIRDGLDVRIHYYEGCIQRVDIFQRPRVTQP